MHEHHKSMEKFDDICDLKHQILRFVMDEVDTGFSEAPAAVQMLGEYVDMIKDLAEAEKACQEACYYESVVKAMAEYGDNPRMGYDRKRNSRGEYVPMEGNQRLGFTPDWRMPDKDWMRPGEDDANYDDRYGRPFNQFRKAKRHYTQTHSPEDKNRMKEHANEHMMETMMTMREIYEDADPDMKKRMKSDLTKLVSEMTV